MIGLLEEVHTVTRGVALDGDHAAGATSLLVASTIDLPEGDAVLRLSDGSTVRAGSVAEDSLTVPLLDPLPTFVEDGTQLALDPPEVYAEATVTLDGVSETCAVHHSLRAVLPELIRETPDVVVVVEHDGSDLVVVNVRDVDPTVDAHIIDNATELLLEDGKRLGEELAAATAERTAAADRLASAESRLADAFSQIDLKATPAYVDAAKQQAIDAAALDATTKTDAAKADAAAAKALAQAAQATADGAIRTFYQAAAPWPDGSSQPATSLGDMWYRTGDQAALRWNGSAWVVIKDTSIAAALAAAQAAQGTADRKVTTYYTSTPGQQPTTPAGGFTAGDLWVDGTQRISRWSGSTWTLVSDPRALANAAEAAAKTAAAADATAKAEAAEARAAQTAAADATAKADAAKTAAEQAAKAYADAQASGASGAALDAAKAYADEAAAAAELAATEAAAADATAKAEAAEAGAAATAAADATAKADRAKADAIAAAKADASTKASAAEAAAKAAASADATAKADAAKAAATATAATDAKAKADAAQAAATAAAKTYTEAQASGAKADAIAAAKADATTKADAAKAAAQAAAAADATAKADAAKAAATSAAAADATTKADAAKAAAIAAAAADATNKADAARAYADTQIANRTNLIDNPSRTGVLGRWGNAAGGTASTVERSVLGTPTKVIEYHSTTHGTLYSANTSRDFFQVDPTKAYQVSVLIEDEKALDAAGSAGTAQLYLGVHLYTAGGAAFSPHLPVGQQGTHGAPTTNFYAYSASASGAPIGGFQRFVFYLMPVGTDPLKMKNLGLNVNFNAIMQADAALGRVRLLNYNNQNTPGGRKIWVGHPTVVEVDPLSVTARQEAVDTASADATAKANAAQAAAQAAAAADATAKAEQAEARAAATAAADATAKAAKAKADAEAAAKVYADAVSSGASGSALDAAKADATAKSEAAKAAAIAAAKADAKAQAEAAEARAAATASADATAKADKARMDAIAAGKTDASTKADAAQAAATTAAAADAKAKADAAQSAAIAASKAVTDQIAANLASTQGQLVAVEGKVDGKANVYVQSSAPTGLAAADKGDIWINDGGTPRVVKVWSGAAWLDADSRITQAVADVAKKTTSFYTTGTTAPATPADGFTAGDLWIDSNGRISRWTGSAWSTASDPKALADAAQAAAAADATAKVDQAKQEAVEASEAYVTAMIGGLAKAVESTSLPGDTVMPKDSVWRQLDATGKYVAVFTQTAAPSGASWSPRTIRSEVLDTVDAGKLTVAGDTVLNDALINKMAVQLASIIRADIGNLTVTGDTVLNGAVAERIGANVASFIKVTAQQITTGNLTAAMNLAAGGKITAGDPEGARVEMTQDGVRVWVLSPDGSPYVVTALTNGVVSLRVADATGAVLGGIGSDGSISGTSLSVRRDPTVIGTPLLGTVAGGTKLGWLDAFARGPVAGSMRRRETELTATSSTPTRGYIKTVVTLQPGRNYRAWAYWRGRANTIDGIVRSQIHYSLGGKVTINDNRVAVDMSTPAPGPNTDLFAYLTSDIISVTAPTKTEFLLAFTGTYRAGSVNVYPTGTRGFLYIEDCGPTLPDLIAAGEGESATVYQSEWVATASRVYDINGNAITGRDNQHLDLRYLRGVVKDYQSSAVLFGGGAALADNASEAGKTLPQALDGATIHTVQVYLHNSSWTAADAPSGNLAVGPLGGTSLPATKTIDSTLYVPEIAAGQGMWIDLPVTPFVGAASTGVVLGDKDSRINVGADTFDLDSGTFWGPNAPTELQPRLRVVYSRAT